MIRRMRVHCISLNLISSQAAENQSFHSLVFHGYTQEHTIYQAEWCPYQKFQGHLESTVGPSKLSTHPKHVSKWKTQSCHACFAATHW